MHQVATILHMYIVTQEFVDISLIQLSVLVPYEQTQYQKPSTIKR